MRPLPPFADIEDLPLDTDEALLERVTALLDVAARRQIWLLFLDEQSRQLPVLMPSYIPRRPGRGHTAHFSHFIGDVVHEMDAAAVVFVLERPGTDQLTGVDREWLALASAACDEAGVPLRGPLLCYDRGVRWIGPEDVGQI